MRRAFSIYDYDAENETVDILYKVFGRGSAILSRVTAGHRLDALGPLGVGFPMPEKSRKLIMVGGGVGIPPVYLLAKTCLREGHLPDKITFLCGFTSSTDCILAERVETLPVTLLISTDDGSAGHHGVVTDLLQEKLEAIAGREKVAVYACGPDGMLKAVQQVASTHKVECYLSLESIMPCGVGTCLGCVVKAAGEEQYLRVCREGPVFRADEVEL